MNEIITTTARTASTIAAEIRILDRQAANTCLQYIIEIGRRLVEAKSLVEDGQWLNYIKNELNYERSTAQNYMRLYERYGSGQCSMFGSFAESETFGNLTYTKALALLQVPEEELEDFAEEHDIESMSTRELQQAIKERNEAIEEKNAAVQALDESVKQVEKLKDTIDAQNAAAQSLNESLQEVTKLKEENDDLNEELELLDKKIENMEKAATEMGDKLTAKDQEIEKLKADVAAANKKAADAKADLKKAKENPDIPAAMMEQLRAEAETSATEKAAAEVQKKLDAANRERAAIEDELSRTQQKLDAAQKAAQLQNPAAAVFKVLFKQVQEDFQELYKSLLEVQQADPALGAKLKTAVESLLSKLIDDIEV